MELKKAVQTFLKQKHPIIKPLLLGFSGGTDSLALADCLIQLQVDFHIAHFDHGWRKSSKEECERLKNWAESRKIAFHTKRSENRVPSEAMAREERFQFFESIFHEGEYESLVLGHQKQDLAETILKRVLEGARLYRLGGMQAEGTRNGMPIWRPLLFVPKEAVLSYIKENRLDPIEDPTNHELKYLRARMRKKIFPAVSEEFGKNIETPLLQIGRQADLLADYLNDKTKELAPVRGPFGVMWDFDRCHPLEIEHVLCQQFDFSSSFREQMIDLILLGRANWQARCKNGVVIVDRKKFFYLEKALPEFQGKVPLAHNDIFEEGWHWEIRTSPQFIQGEGQGWIDWWKGKISLPIPAGSYELIPSASAFRKAQNTHKIPAFLRKTLPMIAQNEKPIADFFTSPHKKSGEHRCVLVSIAINPRR